MFSLEILYVLSILEDVQPKEQRAKPFFTPAVVLKLGAALTHYLLAEGRLTFLDAS